MTATDDWKHSRRGMLRHTREENAREKIPMDLESRRKRREKKLKEAKKCNSMRDITGATEDWVKARRLFAQERQVLNKKYPLKTKTPFAEEQRQQSSLEKFK